MLTGSELLADARANKGTAFTADERDELQVGGLVPAAVTSQSLDEERVIATVRRKGDDTLSKYETLMALKETNERLFYSTVQRYIKECMPLIYTPVVGAACINYGRLHIPRAGMFITADDIGRVDELLARWPVQDVKAIVFTDGGRILGLGDLGACGMGIPVGKLALYSVCAGVPPSQCLPVTLDVGTDNEEFLADPFYIGVRERRLEGGEGSKYDKLVDEFINAAATRFGEDCILQFEDFNNKNAFRLLKKYQTTHNVFNDDIQGTASVILGGLLQAVALTDKPLLKDHTILFQGAGEAGVGIADLLAFAATCEVDGLTLEDARKNIYLVDSKGLVTDSRRAHLQHHKLHYAHDVAEATSLNAAVDQVQPSIIIGVSAQPGSFTRSVVTKMAELNDVPIVCALSNPTSKSECTAAQAYEWTDGRCIFISGSPFDPVEWKGKTHVPGQGNNAYVFGGVGLGSLAVKNTRITDHTFYVAAKALAACATKDDIASGCMYPSLDRIREVSAHIAAAVAEDAYNRGTAMLEPRPDDLLEHCRSLQYDPSYETDAVGGAGGSEGSD